MEMNEIKKLFEDQNQRFQIQFEQINDRFEEADLKWDKHFAESEKQWDERFSESQKHWDEKFDEFAFTVKESFNKMDDRFDIIEFRLDEHGRRFERNERSFEELKHMVYSNGDAIGRMQKKMNEEFAAATIQRSRLSERIGRLENAHGFA